MKSASSTLAEFDARWVRQQVIAYARMESPSSRATFPRERWKNSTIGGITAFLQTLVDSLRAADLRQERSAREFWRSSHLEQGRQTHHGLHRGRSGRPHAWKTFFPTSILPRTRSYVRAVPPPADSHRIASSGRTARHGNCAPHAVPLSDQYGRPEYVLGIAEDITDHAAALEQVRLASIVFEHATGAIVVSDAQRPRSLTVNRAFCAHRILRAEVVGRAATDFETTGIRLPETATMFEQVERKASWSGRGAQLRKDGAPFPTWRNVARVKR